MEMGVHVFYTFDATECYRKGGHEWYTSTRIKFMGLSCLYVSGSLAGFHFVKRVGGFWQEDG